MSAASADSLVVDVVSDVVCPWCFIGKRRLERAEELLGRALEIRWHPFQLNPGMPAAGVPRRDYRVAKFGSLEYSAQLDARVAENGREAGILFRHDLMERTPNSFKAHVLMTAALHMGPVVQNRVAERLFAGYFTMREDVGNPAVLLAIARECGVTRIAAAEDLDDAELAAAVRDEERKGREAGVNGVPLITREGRLVSAGAAPEEILAARLLELMESTR